MSKKGFTLIELLVVLAITGIIAAIAIPVYVSYGIKSRIARQFPWIGSITNYLSSTYQKTGSFPTSVVINGVTIPQNVWTQVNFGDVYGAFYLICNDGKGARVHFNMTNLDGIPGYSRPTTPGPNNTKSVFLVAVRDVNGITTTKCGQSSATFLSNMIPLDYLPSACQCTELVSFCDSGAAC